MILVTGSAGLIGRGIVRALRGAGIEVREFDFRTNALHDTRDGEALRNALEGVTGVIHLAAISRVVWAEYNPQLADEVNVNALRQLLRLIRRSPSRPWLIFASSREVYGEQHRLPVAEDAPLRPLNHYARGKVAGEALVAGASEAGINATICRFSNVFGSQDDHQDRVVVAFARAAALGGCLRLEGGNNRFDFTHVDDVVRGLHLLSNAVAAGETFPPIHFVSGVSTSLHELAQIAQRQAREPVFLNLAAPRSFDVARFCGNPARARALLGWTSRISVEEGFTALVDQLAARRDFAMTGSWLESLSAREPVARRAAGTEWPNPAAA